MNPDQVLHFIAVELADMRRLHIRNGQFWSPRLEALRLLANGSQTAPDFDGTPTGSEGVITLTYEAVGRRLMVSKRTVERLVASGELPTVLVGKSPRVHVDDLNAYTSGLDRRRGVLDGQEEIFGAA
jgi:excisionase family DNA binding protein